MESQNVSSNKAVTLHLDSGYTTICPRCNYRYGVGKTGPRCLEIKECENCRQKKQDRKDEGGLEVGGRGVKFPRAILAF